MTNINENDEIKALSIAVAENINNIVKNNSIPEGEKAELIYTLTQAYNYNVEELSKNNQKNVNISNKNSL